MEGLIPIALLVIVAVIVVLPPRHDPAIRFKERMEKLRKEREGAE